MPKNGQFVVSFLKSLSLQSNSFTRQGTFNSTKIAKMRYIIYIACFSQLFLTTTKGKIACRKLHKKASFFHVFPILFFFQNFHEFLMIFDRETLVWNCTLIYWMTKQVPDGVTEQKFRQFSRYLLLSQYKI